MSTHIIEYENYSIDFGYNRNALLSEGSEKRAFLYVIGNFDEFPM